MPTAFCARIASATQLSLCSSDGLGTASSTARTADISRSSPVGSPLRSTTMIEPSSNVRDPVTPAMRSAAALARPVCMSSVWISIGPGPAASSRRSWWYSAPSSAAYSNANPVTHASGPTRSRSARSRARACPNEDTRSKLMPCATCAPMIRCWCPSVRPGVTCHPSPDRTFVVPSQAARTSAVSPIATMTPSSTASAEANGRSGSSVRMRASTTARAGAMRPPRRGRSRNVTTTRRLRQRSCQDY